MSGAARSSKPRGSQRLRSVMRVAPSAASSQVYVVSTGKGPCAVRITSPFGGGEILDLIGVGERAAQEHRHERDSRADDERTRRLPFDGLDVLVPARGVVGIGRVRRDLGARPLYLDLGLDLSCQSGAPWLQVSHVTPAAGVVSNQGDDERSPLTTTKGASCL